MRAILLIFLMLSLTVSAGEYSEQELPFVEIKTADDFVALGHQSRDQGKVIMLEMSASYCGYCRTLEEEIIKPMLRSGDYAKNVLIRKLEIDSHHPVKGPQGEKTNPAELASRYDVFVTPTLIFLDADGKEVSERILGVNSLDYYGYYVDQSLDQGHRSIQRFYSDDEH